MKLLSCPVRIFYRAGTASAVALLVLGGLLGAAAPATPPRPYPQPDGQGGLTYQGRPLRAVGVNYFDCFLRVLHDPSNTTYEAGFAALNARGIPFARFCATGFWPRDLLLYQTNRAEYFRRLDAVVASARRHGIGLIPSLFWHYACVPDLVGEPVDQWGNENSRTHAWMREYTREVVSRYRNQPHVWAWEFGNEFALQGCLPNAAQHRAPIHPSLGTATSRSARDDLTFAMIRTAYAAFAREVRQLDPHRLILTGDSLPRPSAWHQEQENSWKSDSQDQFTAIFRSLNPEPINTLSAHVYEKDWSRLAWAAEAARLERKPLVVGEFGFPGDPPNARTLFAEQLDTLHRLAVPLAALWVYDFPSQPEYTVTAENARGWKLDALAAANWRAAGVTNLPALAFADRSRLGRPYAKDPSVVRFGGRYLMYFSLPPFAPELAPANAPRGWSIGIAESRDLRNWRKVGELWPEQECEQNGLCAPGARVLNGQVHLFYQTYGNGPRDALCHAVSDDGLRFRRNPTNPIFRPTGAWNNGRAIDAEVIPWGDQLLLYYATRDPTGRTQMLGVASADLRGNYQRDGWRQLGDGPILRPELPWETRCIEAPTLVQRGDTLVMFYAGGYNNDPQQVGVATSRDGVRWERLTDQPFLRHGAPGAWNSSESGHPGAMVDDDGRTYLFYQGNPDKGRTWLISVVEVEWEGIRPLQKP